MGESSKIRLKWHPWREQWFTYLGRGHGRRSYWLQKCQGCGKERLVMDGSQHCGECHDAIRPPYWRSQRAAYLAVRKAIMKGILPRLDGSIRCVDCDRSARYYDHRDYGKPLEVDPVCVRCNARRGPAKDVAHLWVRPIPFTRA